MIKTTNLPILREQDRFFNEVFSDFFGANEPWTKKMGAMSTDIQEIHDHFVFSIDMPGVKKEDIKVEVKKGNLIVSATRKHEAEKGEIGQFLRRERSYGEFSRAFSLTDELDSESIEATYQDGVLHLAVPKRSEKEAKLVDIKSEKSSLFGKLLG